MDTWLTPVLENVHANFAYRIYILVFDLRTRTGWQTDGRTNGRKKHVMRTIKTAALNSVQSHKSKLNWNKTENCGFYFILVYFISFRLSFVALYVSYTPFRWSSKHQANVFKIHVHDVCSNCSTFAWSCKRDIKKLTLAIKPVMFLF